MVKRVLIVLDDKQYSYLSKKKAQWRKKHGLTRTEGGWRDYVLFLSDGGEHFRKVRKVLDQLGLNKPDDGGGTMNSSDPLSPPPSLLPEE